MSLLPSAAALMAPLVEGGEKYLTMRERPWKQSTLDKVGGLQDRMQRRRQG